MGLLADADVVAQPPEIVAGEFLRRDDVPHHRSRKIPDRLAAAQQPFEKVVLLAADQFAVDASERLLRSDGVLSSTSSEDRAAGLEAARGISIEVSNLINDIGALDDGSEEVSEAVDHLETLGNWLRNRCDALTEAWQISADSSDPSADAEAITRAMAAGSAFQRLFSQNYDAWDPAA